MKRHEKNLERKSKATAGLAFLEVGTGPTSWRIFRTARGGSFNRGLDREESMITRHSDMMRRLTRLEQNAAESRKHLIEPRELLFAMVFPPELLADLKRRLERHEQHVREGGGNRSFELREFFDEPGNRWGPEYLNEVMERTRRPEWQGKFGRRLARSCQYVGHQASGCILSNAKCPYAEPCEAGRREIRIQLGKPA